MLICCEVNPVTLSVFLTSSRNSSWCSQSLPFFLCIPVESWNLSWMMLMLHQICYIFLDKACKGTSNCSFFAWWSWPKNHGAVLEIVKFQQIFLKTDESGTEPLHKLQCSFKICEILWKHTSPLSWSRPVQTEQQFGWSSQSIV